MCPHFFRPRRDFYLLLPGFPPHPVVTGYLSRQLTIAKACHLLEKVQQRLTPAETSKMKALILTIMTVLVTRSYAAASSPDPKTESTIFASKEFIKLQRGYTKLGGSLVCFSFEVIGSKDLGATLSGYTMVAESVIANCKADPNDGNDPIVVRLLAFLTVTTDHAEKSTNWNVESLSLVTPPQPD